MDLYYFSAVTWTTLGYGDIRPSETARVFAATEALIGYVYMAILAGKFLTVASLADQVRKRNSDESTDA